MIYDVLESINGRVPSSKVCFDVRRRHWTLRSMVQEYS
jgi:hypothetical protein